MKRPKAPAHLKPETGKWWVQVQKTFELEEHHVRLLTLAAEAWDRTQQARQEIDASGITVSTPDGGIKAHPAVAIERDSRLAFARLLRELDLTDDAPAVRPPPIPSNRK